MSTIGETFANRTSGPYSRPLKVAVVARQAPVTYRGQDGTDRQMVTLAVSDGESCVLAKVYDPAKFAKMTLGQTVVLRDIIRKTEDDQNCVVVTKNTKVFISSALTVPEHFQHQGDRLLNPPPAAIQPLPAALRSPSKQKVSVCGRIVQEEDIRTVSVRGQDVAIKTIVVADEEGRAKVTLWRETSNSPARTGDHVTITDLVTNQYKDEISLSSTARTTIQLTEPPEVTTNVIVTGVSRDDATVELLLNDDSVIHVAHSVIVDAFPEMEEDIEMLTKDGPVNITVTKKGAEVMAMSSP